jgi:hypothetical protein
VSGQQVEQLEQRQDDHERLQGFLFQRKVDESATFSNQFAQQETDCKTEQGELVKLTKPQKLGQAFSLSKTRHTTLASYQSLATAISGVNLLASQPHSQQSQQPRNQRSGSGSCKTLGAPNTHMVRPRKDRRETGHTRNQHNRNEHRRHNVPCKHPN